MQIVVSQQEVERTKSAAPPFVRRVLVVCLVGVAGLAVWKLSDVLVLAFGAALARPSTRSKPPDANTRGLVRRAGRAHAPRANRRCGLTVRLANRIAVQPARKGLAAKPHAARP